ncbi:DUF6228 family protein [Nocardiopsis composta]|uniref:Uncharacterized protein n=1 Tax=Nocardiopsis composta TaxID=157465 RepID=A0A7W8QQB1_9ACTN|nr:DUF6228 family protein [Nocardiopsis composta]MBB5434617.1 hypothetical protein [Nocardiopsis composta]
MIDYDDSGSPVVEVGDPGPRPVQLVFSGPVRPFGEDLTLDFLVRACGRWGSVETRVRTWDGDGLDAFLSSLAEDFRGWEGARTWHSLEYDLTLSAEHRSGGHVHLTWGVREVSPFEEWRFEAATVHAAGEEMRGLAGEMRAFLAGPAR